MNTTEHYNTVYQKTNFFGYDERLYGPYLRTLLHRAKVAAGSSILDVGCGQGCFSHILKKCGMTVVGLDTSETGIRAARAAYGGSGIEFLVADINDFAAERLFDCVFARSLSLYNIDDFSTNRETTRKLMTFVRPGGMFLFVYNTNLKPSRAQKIWRFHTLEDARQHFLAYRNAQCFFTLKVNPAVLRSAAFTSPCSALSTAVSWYLGVGGDIVCMVRSE